MIHITCDICCEEPKDNNFVFEATKVEMLDVYDVSSKSLNPQRKMDKKMIQICKDCYNKHIAKLLKI